MAFLFGEILNQKQLIKYRYQRAIFCRGSPNLEEMKYFDFLFLLKSFINSAQPDKFEWNQWFAVCQTDYLVDTPLNWTLKKVVE